jgi:hypothetical protein
MAKYDYEAALERLINNKPQVLIRGKYNINPDTVALEAGAGRGAIKSKRKKELITKIKKASEEHKPHVAPAGMNKHDTLEEKYQASLNREFMLTDEIKRLEERVRELDSNVIKFPLQN